MADKTLYHVLEVSATASPEVIRAAYQRLTEKFDPDRAENAGNSAVRVQHDAVKEAFLTLANPEKRKQYDAKRVRARAVLENVQVVERMRREREIAVQRLTVEQRNQESYSSQAARTAERERMQKEAAERRAESQRQLDETRTQNAAQQQLARDRAELCRIERERYGKAISC